MITEKGLFDLINIICAINIMYAQTMNVSESGDIKRRERERGKEIERDERKFDEKRL